MITNHHLQSVARRAIACGLTAALVFTSAAPVAYADPQSDLDAARQRIESLTSSLNDFQDKLATASSDLENTQYDIDENQSKIDDTQQQLGVAKDDLSKNVHDSYISGGISLMDIVAGSNSFSDFVTNVYYATRMSDAQSEKISAVTTLQSQLKSEQSDLEARQASQQKTIDDINAQISEYNQKVAEAQDYYDGLSTEVQQQLAQEAQNEVSEANENGTEPSTTATTVTQLASGTATASEVQDTAQPTDNSGTETGGTTADSGAADTSDSSGSTGTSGGTSSNGGSSSSKGTSSSGSSNSSSTRTQTKTQSTPTTNSGGNKGTSGGSRSSSSSGSKASAGGGLSTAYAMIGVPYVWSGTSTSGVDCSGLVNVCYGSKRGRTTYQMIASLKASGSWKTDKSQLQVGDLVFPSTGHVGIYIGNNKMIHAPSPGRTVCITTVYAFIGGGTY